MQSPYSPSYGTSVVSFISAPLSYVVYFTHLAQYCVLVKWRCNSIVVTFWASSSIYTSKGASKGCLRWCHNTFFCWEVALSPHYDCNCIYRDRVASVCLTRCNGPIGLSVHSRHRINSSRADQHRHAACASKSPASKTGRCVQWQFKLPYFAARCKATLTCPPHK